MNGNYLLDTNIVIALFAGDESIRTHLAEVDEVFIPSIVLGELYYGAYRSSFKEKNAAKIDDFSAASAVLAPTRVTAKRYGLIKQALQSKGFPIPENDIWIASIAMEHELTIATRDEHFSKIDNVRIENW